jgi:hypothetical protein
MNWIKVRRVVADAAPAVGAVGVSLFVYRRKQSLPLAVLGALGGYGAVVAVQRLAQWLMSGPAMLPTTTASIPSPLARGGDRSAPLPEAKAGAGVPVPPTDANAQQEKIMGYGVTKHPDGSVTSGAVSLIDADEDGRDSGSNIVPFIGGRA